MTTLPAGHPEKPQGDEGRELLLRMNGGGHEKLANWGLDHLEINEASGLMLDIGCGGGANLRRLLELVPAGRAIGIDYSSVAVELSRETCADLIEQGKCEVIEGSASNLPFKDDNFDLVTAFETVYFWPNIIEAFQEVRRVLKPGGLFLICNDDNGADDSSLEFTRQIQGMSIYTAPELNVLLLGSEFNVLAIDEDDENRICAIACK